MSLNELYRRVEEHDRARRLRPPFSTAAFVTTLAILLIAATLATTQHLYPSDPVLLVVVIGPFAVAMLIKHLFWRLQRRSDRKP